MLKLMSKKLQIKFINLKQTNKQMGAIGPMVMRNKIKHINNHNNFKQVGLIYLNT